MDLLEESIATLRECGATTWLCYYTGTVPFVLALLYFWSEMSAGAYAEESLSLGSLGMAFAFIWMRCWQSVFVNRLLVIKGTQEPIRWSPGQIFRLIAQQALVQSTALFILPIAALITLPFGWTYAFYQNFLIDGCGHPLPVRVLAGRSADQSKLWPGQNHVGLCFLAIAAFVVFLNALSLIWLVPGLMKMLFGVETMFSRNPFSLLNTTVLMIAVGFTYLVLGPVTKTFYVLRCFYGRAVTTGEDLRVAIRRFRAVALCLLGGLVLLAGGTARAADAQKLDQSIDRVLTRPEYAWRAPRVEGTKAEKVNKTLLSKFADAVHDFFQACWAPIKKGFRKFIKWLGKLFKVDRPEHEEDKPGLDWHGVFEKVIFGLCAVVLIAAGGIAWRAWKRRGIVPQITAEPVRAMPDLRSEEVTADELPEDRWVELAEKLAAEGEFRLSLRALYLAGLAHLCNRELVTIVRSKSNKEFLLELGWRARSHTELISAFSQSVKAFENVWYGTGEATPEALESYSANLQRIKAC